MGAARPSRRLSFAQCDRLRAGLDPGAAPGQPGDHAGAGEGQRWRTHPDRRRRRAWIRAMSCCSNGRRVPSPRRPTCSDPSRCWGESRRSMHASRAHGQPPQNFERLTWDFEARSASGRIGAHGATAWGSMQAKTEALCARRRSHRASGLRHSARDRIASASSIATCGLPICMIDGERPRSSISTTAASAGISMIVRRRSPSSSIGPMCPALIDAWVSGYRQVAPLSAGGRGRDPDLRHVPAAAAGRLDRLACRNRSRASRWAFPIRRIPSDCPKNTWRDLARLRPVLPSPITSARNSSCEPSRRCRVFCRSQAAVSNC